MVREQLWCEKQSAGRSLSWLANISDTQFYNCPPGVVLNSTDQTAVFTNKTYNQGTCSSLAFCHHNKNIISYIIIM